MMLKRIFLFFLLTVVAFSVSADEKRAFIRADTAQIKSKPLPVGQYRALLIANNRYEDQKNYWKPLSNPVRDAKELKTVLIDKYGFPVHNVEMAVNADRAAMYQALNRLIKNTEDGDSVLIFYAGHGYYDKNLEEGYWIPVNAQGKDDSSYFSFATLRSKVKAISKKARHTFLISDSCFSGSFLNNSRAPNENTAIEMLASRRSVQILTAGGNEYVSDGYKNTGHSPFSYFLLSELKKNNKPYLMGFQLAGFIRNTVLFNSEQTPQLGVIGGAGHENGDFIFRLEYPKNMAADTIVKARISFQSKAQTAEIENLLSIADSYYVNKAYLSPPSENAYAAYLKVIQQDPMNSHARQGLRNIAQVYINKAKVSIQENAFTSARKQLDNASRVDQSHPDLEAMRRQLEQSEKQYLMNKRLLY